ncbi:phage recombination protein Bet [Streptomyces sp. DSM 40750]|uniref:phage recombination protein Bet n=1 Tax=Streptomyces sp. DSM 40750 TaxID=2801030 RepID=UPI00214C52C2|nr:phage recombination protein Bet [Streptomyces sp. DSM 40750]UUU21677.1 phage recombination protein Bet [Streptomyces sp. DSM 40750]
MSAELAKTGGALAIRPDQTQWTEEQGLVLRQSGISDAVTKAELSGFLHLCQRTGLDPFSRQIYLIGRYSKKEQRDVFTPQTGIDGYRVIAQRVTSQTGGSYGYEDTLWCDTSGKWRDVWLADVPPAAAKATVIRNGQRFSAVARFSEYVQAFPDGNPKGLWAKMPAGQIAKCAEALALRKAFPHDLAGVYTAEEMAQADNPAPERHLRKVQPGEGDPWANDGQQGTTAVKGRSQPAQDIADVAAQTSNQGAVKDLYRQARDEGLLAETVKVDRELSELGAYLIARGKQLAAPAPEKTGDGSGEVIEGEIVETLSEGPSVVEGPSEADVAEHQLRTAAKAAGLDNLDAEFEQSYGIPIAQAGAQQLREMTAILTGHAA